MGSLEVGWAMGGYRGVVGLLEAVGQVISIGDRSHKQEVGTRAEGVAREGPHWRQVVQAVVGHKVKQASLEGEQAGWASGLRQWWEQSRASSRLRERTLQIFPKFNMARGSVELLSIPSMMSREL